MSVVDHQVRIEKTFRFRAPELFRAISKGRLFFNCSGDYETFENDFRVGGGYRVRFRSYGITNVGKYLEIVPDQKIVFTWGDQGADTHFPMTRVTIELKPDGDQTRLLLVHTGFRDQATAEDHNQGWTGGLTDLGAEMEKGMLRMVRTFKVSREKLYNACRDPKIFFGIITDTAQGSCDFRVGGRYQFKSDDHAIEGRYEEIVPNERIVFTWDRSCGGEIPGGSRVELRFDDEDEGGSSLELIHTGLKTEELVESHREGWNYLTNRLPERI